MVDPDRAEVRYVLTVLDGGVIEVWMRDGMPGADLADELRRIADGFETGDDLRRVR